MNNLREIYQEALRECESQSIPLGRIFDITTRDMTHHGECERDRHANAYTIRISRALLECAPRAAVKETILHELCHTCDNAMNHGETWKRWANKLNRAYGYTISRCTSFEDKYGAVNPRELPYKYVIVCDKCGKFTVRNRASELTKHPAFYRHECGGDFTVIRNH